MYRIFIIEDDETIATSLKIHLESWCYEALCIKDFSQVSNEFNACEPHLVLMDISLPFFNGYHWCQAIRSQSQVPIIFISSTSDNMNIVMAMNMGADDFIAKPFDLGVLTAKIAALLRRSYDFTGADGRITVGEVSLDTGDISLYYQDHHLELTKNEYLILQVLMENAGHVISREAIRSQSQVPIIFISSTSDNMNIVMAMNMGADDFIAKPFDLGVLTAKIAALLRRSYDFTGADGRITVGEVSLDTGDISLYYQDHHLELTKNEYLILQVLMENAGHVISRDTLMEKLWETDCYIDDNTLTVNIARLRKRLGDMGLTDFIRTKRGLGYLVS